MDRNAFGISVLVASIVAMVLSEFVLFRAAWLLRPGFDSSAFLIQIGSGPLAGLATLTCAVIAFWGCRRMLRRMHPPRHRIALISRAAIYGICGTVVGLAVGALVAWTLIRVDGMGNGGDTRIIRYELGDFVQAALLGMGICLAAVLTLRPAWAENPPANQLT